MSERRERDGSGLDERRSGMVPGEELVDARCSTCIKDGKGEYRTTFRCGNCGLSGVLRHSLGHKTYNHGARCPQCECDTLHAGDAVAADPGPPAPVTVLDADLAPSASFRPCPHQILGPFLGADAGYLRCGGLEGHGGSHYFRVEWEDESGVGDDA